MKQKWRKGRKKNGRRRRKYTTYLAGPMQALGWSGTGWRVYFTHLLKKYNVRVQDPVKSESKKTGLSATKTKELLKALTVLVVQGDRDAEKKFKKMMRRIAAIDYQMVARSDFIIAQVIEGVVSIGATAEIFYAALIGRPVYVLYRGRPQYFSHWLLYRVVASGGKVFTEKGKDGIRECMRECLRYLCNKFELEELERNGAHKK